MTGLEIIKGDQNFTQTHTHTHTHTQREKERERERGPFYKSWFSAEMLKKKKGTKELQRSARTVPMEYSAPINHAG